MRYRRLHPRHIRIAALVVAAVLPILLAPSLMAQRSRDRDRDRDRSERSATGERWTWSERISAGAWLKIYDSNGEIRVTEAEGETAEVVGLKRGDADDEALEIRVVREGSDVIICGLQAEEQTCDAEGIHGNRRGDGWRGHSHGSVDFTVKLPRGVKLRVMSGNGEISVSGARAEVAASSGNGDVSVSATGGPVRANSGNGEIEVLDATHPVTARTGNGRVTVTTKAGPVNASSGNGSIDVLMESLVDDSDMRFSTGNGRVTLTVPENFSAEIETSLGQGELRSDFPIRIEGRFDSRNVRGTIGSGGRRVRISSGNGSAEVRKVRS